MTGRERVKAALTFATPDRVPRDLWTLPYVRLFRKDELDAMLAKYPSDFGEPHLGSKNDNARLQRYARACTYTDEWGCRWRMGEAGVIGEVISPILADWSKLDGFEPPWDVVRKRDVDYINRSCDESELFMMSQVCSRPFERMQFLRGAENLYLDLAYDRPEVGRLIEIVHDFYLEDVKSWCGTNVDGVFLMDDWGTNLAMLINPDIWRAVFKPLYREYCELIHAAGKFVFMHCDGHIADIFGDFIEIGVDAINSQLFCMDIEELGRRYAGQITFWGEIDRQHVLPFGTANEVSQAVQRVRSALDTGKGGVIAQCEWGKDNSAENIEAVMEAWS